MKELIKKALHEGINVNALGVNVSRPSQELILMRGVPGSGKSTAAKKLVAEGIIHSTDDVIEAAGDYKGFFEKMKKDNNFSALGKMHEKNFQNAKKSMVMGVSPVVIDNTNLKAFEMKRYVETALQLGYSDENIKFVNVGTGGVVAEVLAARNTHGVPLDKIKQMIQTYNSNKDMTVSKILKGPDAPVQSDILYSAVVLDQKSHGMLLMTFAKMIQADWKRYAHHMTIAMNEGAPEADLNTEVELQVISLGVSDMVVAVGVEGYPSKNATPHVTLAVNPNGGKPAMSNQITDWKEINGFKIRGVVTNIKRDL